MQVGDLAPRLSQILESFSQHTLAVIGDPVLDAYRYGTTHRISREAPVLIVREDALEYRLGGAANTAANLAALGAQVRLLGLVGDDEDGTRLITLAQAKGIDTTALHRQKGASTVTKTRILAGAVHTTKQQMLRIDRENDRVPAAHEIEQLTYMGRSSLNAAQALIVSDYGNGHLTKAYASLAQEAMARNLSVIVDSRRHLTQYTGVTAVTPNQPETEECLGIVIQSPEDALVAAARLRVALHLQAVLLTRGREGMAIAQADAAPLLLPAHGGHEAVDVTGAGDTVTATFALALCAGASVFEAAVLANCAASIVVGSVGAATCTSDQIRAALMEPIR